MTIVCLGEGWKNSERKMLEKAERLCPKLGKYTFEKQGPQAMQHGPMMIRANLRGGGPPIVRGDVGGIIDSICNEDGMSRMPLK